MTTDPSPQRPELSSAKPQPGFLARHNRLVFILGLVVLYAAVFVYAEQLRFPREMDEGHFWRTSEKFSHRLFPEIQQLRDYGELSTPLPFVIFGQLNYLLGGEHIPGRYLNFALSFGIALLIGLPVTRGRWREVLAACGLLACPYYLGVSAHFYTDILACTFVLLGVWAYRGKRHIIAALFFVLAIACRQYMLAFPAAVAVHEGLESLQHDTRLWRVEWIAPALAAASILAWFAFFGGPAPASEMADQHLGDAAFSLHPDHSLYFLACLGAYFVIPESILFLRLKPWKVIRPTSALIVAGALLVLFLVFPPLGNESPYLIETMGFLDRALRSDDLALPVAIRQAVLWVLAAAAGARFSRFDLTGWLVVINAALMMFAHIAWDKYALPLLVVLWYFAPLARTFAPRAVAPAAALRTP